MRLTLANFKAGFGRIESIDFFAICLEDQNCGLDLANRAGGLAMFH